MERRGGGGKISTLLPVTGVKKGSLPLSMPRTEEEKFSVLS